MPERHNRPEQPQRDSGDQPQRPTEPAQELEEQRDTNAASADPADGDETSSATTYEPSPQTSEETTEVKGRRVTRRTIDRREVTEYTEETITEDIPLEAYQGPPSRHPAPVG